MPTSTGTVTLGSGVDTLALTLSEDPYAGDAQFTISVDGVQVGGTQTVNASRAAGQTQLFNILGTFGSSQHTVTVNFLNDAYGGTATTDRNLYVTGATINGATIAGSTLNETSSGPQSFVFSNAVPATVTIGSGTDTLSLSIAEDSYAGDAQFTISVDGVQQGGVQTATASHAAGKSQAFNILGTFGSSQHTVTVNFLNDAYGGSATTDRNLYVTGATINGAAIAGSTLNETSSGPQSFAFRNAAPTTPTPTPTPTPGAPATVTLGSGPDTLSLSVSEDAYAGDAQFTISIDGIQVGGTQTTTASRAAGQSQTFNVLGTFGSSQHTVTVNFLNDAYGGSATTDRNLYVTGATIAGAAIAGGVLNETSGGPQSFVFRNAAATTPPTAPPTVTLGSGPDTLSLSVSEDAYSGDAQFTVSVDGVQQGGLQTTTASKAAGQAQTFNILGTFGSSQHTVTVNFLNDAYGGSSSTDRNLYLNGASLNGTAISGSTLNEYASGPQSFGFGTATSSPSPTPTPPVVTPAGPAFYVSASGSNSGDGSAARPFATIQYALSQMEAKAVHNLYVQNGTYNISSTITLGSADNGDTILAAQGATPILNAVNGLSTILSLFGVQNVTISGLTFQNASFDPNGAALLMNGASGNTITGNTFTGNAEAALFVNSSSNTFSSNTILNTATSAVEMKDGSNSNLLTNNLINGIGAVNLTGGGFYAHGAANNTFSNNLIENAAGAGINIQDFGYGTTNNTGNVITRNQIINTSTSHASTDDGAIYILGRGGTDLKTTISMNFISGVGNVNPDAHVEGIYLDDNASGVTVTSNIVRGVQSDATELHGGYGNKFTNNIFDLGTFTRTAALIQQPPHDQPAALQPALTNDVYSNNIIVSQQTNPYYVYVYFDPEAVHVPIHDNLYYDPMVPAGGPSSNYGVFFPPNAPAGTLPTVAPVNDTNPFVGNPNFVPGTLGSYNLGPGSAASLIGFVPIDTSLIGPR